MTYQVLSRNHYEAGDYELVPLREQDLAHIMIWRNDQIDVLRQSRPLTPEDQTRYFEQHIKPSYSEPEPRIILFSFLFQGACIGYGGLTNIDWPSKRVELSFLLDTQRIPSTYEKDFSNYLTLIKEVAFNDLTLNRIFTETYDLRPLHVSILEKSGFKLEGRMREHVKVGGRYVDSLIHGFLRSDYV